MAARRRLLPRKVTRASSRSFAGNRATGSLARLTVRAMERRPLPDPRLADPMAADSARLARAAIDVVVELEITGSTVGADVVAQRAAAFRDRGVEHQADGVDERRQ